MTVREFILWGILVMITGFFFLHPQTSQAAATCSCDYTDGHQEAISVNTEAECDNYFPAGAVQCNFYPGGGINQRGNPGGPVKLDNPLGSLSDPRIIVGQVIRVALGIIGSLALVLFIYGGMLWMTSSGNTEMITKGRNTLLWAVIGLLVVFGSYTIINFVLQNLPRG